MQYVIETFKDVERNVYNQVIKYDSKEKAEQNLLDYHWSWKAKVVEYDPKKHIDLPCKINVGD